MDLLHSQPVDRALRCHRVDRSPDRAGKPCTFPGVGSVGETGWVAGEKEALLHPETNPVRHTKDLSSLSLAFKPHRTDEISRNAELLGVGAQELPPPTEPCKAPEPLLQLLSTAAALPIPQGEKERPVSPWSSLGVFPFTFCQPSSLVLTHLASWAGLGYSWVRHGDGGWMDVTFTPKQNDWLMKGFPPAVPSQDDSWSGAKGGNHCHIYALDGSPKNHPFGTAGREFLQVRSFHSLPSTHLHRGSLPSCPELMELCCRDMFSALHGLQRHMVDL